MTKRFENYYKWITERYTVEENLIINEGLITSYPIDILLKELKRRYTKIEYDQISGKIIVEEIPLNQKESLKKKLDLYGYFIADEQVDDADSSLFGILIEPKFPSEIPFSYLHDKIQYCYHITTDKYIDKINQIGLVPKESKREFYKTSGNRIYFLITDNPKKDLLLLKNMLKVDDQRKNIFNKHSKYYVLRINFHQLNEDLVFYRDSRLFPEGNFKGMGIFTLGNIPPDKIEFLGEI
jgi:hypothetical protein